MRSNYFFFRIQKYISPENEMLLKIEPTFFLNLTLYFSRKRNYFFQNSKNIFPEIEKNIFINWVAPVRFRTQVNGEMGNSTPRHAQTLNRSSPKVAYVIRALLFLIFVNDIDEGIANSLLKFADDTKLVGTGSSDLEIEQLRSDLKQLGYSLADAGRYLLCSFSKQMEFLRFGSTRCPAVQKYFPGYVHRNSRLIIRSIRWLPWLLIRYLQWICIWVSSFYEHSVV